MASEMVEFASNGISARGHLARPDSGSGPGVVVVQEWWGLDPGIKHMADRLAENGFVALAPDLYHGELAEHDEMDRAGELMQQLPPDRATRDMSGAVDYLLGLDEVIGDGIGVVGFCMGGMLSLLLTAARGDAIKAAVPFYGFPSGDGEPDWSGLTAKVRGHMAENDDFFGPDAARELEAKLKDAGKDVVFQIHEGTGHAFMAEHNALGNYDAELAEKLWPEFTQFLHQELG